MKVSFPAMRGVIGKRQYFATMMALSEIPHLFKFNDWEQFTPELRAQRVLVKARVPEIVKYIVDNEDSYLFSCITAAYNTEIKFKPFDDGADIGYLEMDLENAKFLINDGQHRCAAITAALNENPAVGKEKISVLLFPWESLERAQQMFTDLNRFVQKTSKSLSGLKKRALNEAPLPLSRQPRQLSHQVTPYPLKVSWKVAHRLRRLSSSPKVSGLHISQPFSKEIDIRLTQGF
jgi:DNA sulfur modification protein DndB